MNYKILLALLLLLLPVPFGYEIVGDTIIYENEFVKLEVSPHTDVNFQINPAVLPSFEQTFKITNKTNQDRNLFFAFVFNKPLLSAKAFNLEPIIKTRDSYGWVSKSFQCNHDFNYTLNAFPDSVNPHSLNCFDVNAEGIYFYKKDFAFYSGDLPSRIVNYYSWDVNGTEEYSEMDYVNRSSYFNSYYSPYKNKIYYYINLPYKFDPLGSNQFRINYMPDPSDESYKWDLIAWSGSEWDCILFDSCDAVYLLDPNWQNLTASTRYPINISVGATGTDTNTTFIYSGNITDFGLTKSDDVNRLLIYDQDKNIEISRVIDLNRDTGDINIFFIPLIPLAPNTDYNGTDYNGLMAYTLDANYADQNESWNQSFWWGSNFEKASEQGTWIDEGGDGTWTYPSTTQLDGTTGIVKQVQWGSSRETVGLDYHQFDPTVDYNLFVSFDSYSTAYDGITMFKALGQLGNTCPNSTCHRIENVVGAANFRLYSDTQNNTFGSSASGTWYHLTWNIDTAKNTGKELSGTTSIANSSSVAKYFGLDIDAINSAHVVRWDNIRIYKKLLNPPVITLGAAENQSASPDVNLNYPVGAETFYKTSTYDINFSITDADSSSWLVDLNIFQDSNQVSVIDDVNTDSATITCTGSDCIYSLTVPEGWVSGDWNMLVFVSDGTNTAQDATAAVFTITTIPEPVVNPETTERYFTEDDPRFFDSNRYFSPEDQRLDDTNRYYEQDDYRQETSVLNQKSLFKVNQNIIIVVLVIILIAAAVILWKRK